MSKIQQKQIQRRADILEKAVDILKVTPFEEISVQDICKAANISVGTFYHYFKQKSELLVGLMGLIDNYMQNQVFPELSCDSAYENLKRFSRGFAAYVEESGIKISKLISSAYPTDYNLDNEKRPLYVKLLEIITRGQSDGEFKSSFTSEKTADMILIAMSGVAVDWSRRDGNYSITDRMEEITDLFFPALLNTAYNK